MASYHGQSEIVVKGAGQAAVNGIYMRDGEVEGASKFSRQGEFDGEQCIFSVFQCKVSDNTKHWYISIVPTGDIPGTRDDTDFYSAPVTDTCLEFPPLGRWPLSNHGPRPPPTLLFHGPSKIVVKGAGQAAVNGVYMQDGEFDGASKFSREGEFDGEQCIFSVFQCKISDNTKHWYISIVPTGDIPGTREDTDFYTAPVADTCLGLPPLGGWRSSDWGLRPPPTLSFHGPSENVVNGADQAAEDDVYMRDGEFDGEQCVVSDPSRIVVKGAGQAAVNGIYMQDGEFDGASKFSRQGKFDGEQRIFSVFKCKVSDNTKHWYISIVPTGDIPGTRDDTDFYTAPVADTCLEFPPLGGWTRSNYGLRPPPTLSFHGPSENVVNGADQAAEDDVYMRDGEFDGEQCLVSGPSKVVVKGAGQAAVNGIYMRDGEVEGASKFSRQGEFDGEQCIFSVFQCKVSDNTKHWYISIVPTGDIPGTRNDTPFYSAPVTDICLEFPPLGSWPLSNHGLRPPPTLLFHGPSKIVVKGAGQAAVNGVYMQDGEFDGASKFSREGEFDGEQCIFSVFQCKISDNTKHWYISIVPTGDIPGTREDTDFYTAPVADTCLGLPPLGGWRSSDWGLRPPPTLLFQDD